MFGSLLLLWLTAFSAGPTGAAPSATLTDADLAPIALGADTPLVRELIARGRWRDAAAKVTRRTPEARLVKGWLLAKGKRPEAALAELDALDPKAAGSLSLLADTVHLTRARALLDLERFDEAVAAAERVDPATRAGRMALRIKARALREGGQRGQAEASYQAIIASGLPDEVPVGLLGLARVFIDAGKAARAIPLLRRVDVEFPAHWTASLARNEAQALVKRSRSLRAAWSNRSAEEEITRAERLLDEHRNEMVIKALTPLTRTRLTGELRCRQRYALGRALRKRLKWKTARPLLEDAVTACEPLNHDLAPWSRHLAGKAAERLGFEVEAADHFRAQMKNNPTHRLADDGGYYVVRHLIEDEDDFEAARAEVTRLVEQFPAGDMMPDAVFFVAQHAMLAGDWETAGEVLALDDRLAPQRFEHRSGGRTIYWRARIAHALGRKQEAIDGYRAAMATWPLSWYGLLGYSRLRELDRKLALSESRRVLRTTGPGPTLPAADSAPWRFTLPPGLVGPGWERARLLARLGLISASRRAFADLTGAHGGDLDWLSAWVLDRAGAYHFSHHRFRRDLAEFRRFAPHGHLRKHWQLAYPAPFGRLVDRASKDTGVDRNLIYGIMREESGFNPRVESFANAIGLMQLILPTARSMAKKGEGKITRSRLTRPDLNVKLGARYLAYVGERTGGVEFTWPAGYNAGAGALKRWLKDRGHLPLDLFVETIPYEEARGYIKRVNAGRATYRLLYGEPAEPMPYLSQRTKAKKKKVVKRKPKKRKPKKRHRKR